MCSHLKCAALRSPSLVTGTLDDGNCTVPLKSIPVSPAPSFWCTRHLTCMCVCAMHVIQGSQWFSPVDVVAAAHGEGGGAEEVVHTPKSSG